MIIWGRELILKYDIKLKLYKFFGWFKKLKINLFFKDHIRCCGINFVSLNLLEIFKRAILFIFRQFVCLLYWHYCLSTVSSSMHDVSCHLYHCSFYYYLHSHWRILHTRGGKGKHLQGCSQQIFKTYLFPHYNATCFICCLHYLSHSLYLFVY